MVVVLKWSDEGGPRPMAVFLAISGLDSNLVQDRVLFERSEFLIATSKKKKTVRLPVCTRVRLILVLVWKKLSWF